jgi:hypothetical protein
VTLEAPIDKGVVAVSAKKEKIVVCHCNSLDKNKNFQKNIYVKEKIWERLFFSFIIFYFPEPTL